MNHNEVPIEQELAPLFDPKSVVVIGASNNWSKWGFSTFASVLNGFPGRVYAVNNSESEVLGYKTYQRVSDIPADEPVDLAIFVIPAPAVPGVMEDCVRKGVRAAVVISAGFAETGAEGKKLQDRVLAIARQGNIRFTGPNCMGFWSASSNLRGFMFPLPVQDGPLAFVSQGGNVGGAVVQMAFRRGMGLHRYVSCGCTADIQVEDYIEYFGRDPKVQVIMAYIEGLADGTRFIEKVRRVSAHKPVIALKPGRTQAGAKAIASHSGALAGSSDLYDSAFKKAGVIRVDTPQALLDVAMGFITQPLPKGNRVAIITPGGSYGVISADTCASLGLDVIDLPEETIREFDRVFPPRWSRGNPVDPAGDRNFIAYVLSPELLLKLPQVEAMIFMGFDSLGNFGSVYSDLNRKLAGVFNDFFKKIAALIPEDEAGGAELENQWIRSFVGEVVHAFFSLFGTSDPSDVDAFLEQITDFITGEKNRLVFSAKFRKVIQVYRDGNYENIGDLFAQLFNPLVEATVLNWIKTYGKPVISTTFMGSAPPVTELGYYAYPFAEQAILVLAKMLEYKNYLAREHQGS